MILCSNPKAQYLSHKSEIDEAVSKVLEGDRYILGKEVISFEEQFSKYIGASFGIGVGSGTEALHIALSAMGIGPGDEVITPSHTAVATVSAIVSCGAKPVFVEVEPDHYTVDPHKIRASLSKNTKAIIVVHIYGHPADMDPIMEIARNAGIKVVEDCAQAHGAEYKHKKVGSIGDVGCFSFYPTKNLGAIGDGGMIVTNDASVSEKARLIREYGWKERYVSDIHGWNSRLDEIQAAILKIKLRYLDQDNQKRISIAERYSKELSSLPVRLPSVNKDSKHVFHLYVVRTKDRDKLITFLKDNGVQALVHYPKPVHMQPAYRQNGSGLQDTEKISEEIISLPIFPELSFEEIEKICVLVKKFYKK